MEPAQPSRRRWIALVAIFLLAAGVRFAFYGEISGTALDRWHRFDQSDMATYVEQARRIREESLLQPEPYHPYHTWQTVAPPAKWLSWYGPHAFHQAPLYSYLLATVLPWSESQFAPVKLVQLLLGAGSCVLLLLIARRLWNDTAGIAAGVLAACYGPLLFLEAQLLREGPALFWILALFLGLVVQLERTDASPRRRALALAALGLGAGAFSMFHEMGNVVTLVILLALVLERLARATPRAAALALLCLLGGWLVGFAPLLARNLAVGASPFSVSCRTTVNFVESNVADAQDGGATFAPPSPTAVKVLDAAGGSGLAALRGTWASYDGDVGRLVSNLWAKFAANLIPWEVPDNTSYEFFREHASTLRFAPTFAWLFPIAFAGILLAVPRLRRARPAPEPASATGKKARTQPKPAAEAGATAPVADVPPPLSGLLALLCLFVALASALSLVHTVARFRMYLVPLCILFAAFAIAGLIAALRARRLGTAALIALAAVAGLLLQRAAPTDAFVRGLRTIDYAIACKLAIEDGRIDEARGFAERARAKFPGDGQVYSLAGYELEQRGERASAIEFYRRALEIQPGAPYAQQSLRRLEGR